MMNHSSYTLVELGVDHIVTPVRRSTRNLVLQQDQEQRPTATPVRQQKERLAKINNFLEEYDYAYVPNKVFLCLISLHARSTNIVVGIGQ
jgi:hypothetical protein